MKTNTEKAINYLQLYKMDHEIGYLFDANRMIKRELMERKKARQSGANTTSSREKN